MQWRTRAGAIAALALLGSFVTTAPATAAQDVTFYVSPGGDDAAAGTEQAPFATLPRAQQAVRDARAAGDAPAVLLREGTYRLTESLAFGADDSGTPEQPVSWSAYPGEDVVISGGLSLDASAFSPVTDPAVVDRLQPDALGSIVQIDLTASGVTDFGEIEQSGFALPPVAPAPEFFVDDEAQTLARYPNEGTVDIGTVVDPGGNARAVMDDPAQVAIEMAKPATFAYEDPRPASWASTDDVWMYGYWFYDWADGNLPLASVDATAGTLTTSASSYYSIQEGQRYYYYNVLEELDAEGEYYLDRQTGLLYYYAPDGFEDSSVELSLIKEPLLMLQDASDIEFSGVTLQNGRSDGIRAHDSDRLRFDGLTLERFGQMGIVFGLRDQEEAGVDRSNVGIEGGTGNVVSGATIAHTGTGGVFLGGGDRQTLTPGGNIVTGSDIGEYARLKRTYSAAVELAGVGNTAQGNYLHDAPHLAVYLHGNDHHVAGNAIMRVMQEAGDGGAIYLGRDFSETGHVIENNYLKDIDNQVASGPKVGVYLDDLASGVTVRGNVIQNAGRAVLVGGGRENLIERNVIIGASERSIHLDARGFGFANEHLQPGGTLVVMLDRVPYQTGVWAAEYPWLPTVLADTPEAPVNTRLIDNVVIDSPAFYIEPAAEPYITQDGNIQLGSFDVGLLDLDGPVDDILQRFGL